MKCLGVLVAFLLSAAVVAAPTPLVVPDGGDDSAFVAALDLTALGQIAVHTDGRLKSFDSFAASMMRLVSGPHRFEDRSATFTYLDLLMRPHLYHAADIVYVKKKPIRQQIVLALTPPGAVEPDPRMDRFMETGLISEELLLTSEVSELLGRLNTDLIKTAKFVDMIDTALSVKRSESLLARWRVIPPAGTDRETPWSNPEELVLGTGSTTDLAPQTRQILLDAWRQLVEGWATTDARQVNEAANELARVLPEINPVLYPSPAREGWPWSFAGAGTAPWWAVAGIAALAILGLVFGRGTGRRLAAVSLISLAGFTLIGLWLNGFGASLTSSLLAHPVGPLEWESAYFRAFNLTWFWVFYALSLVPLLLSVVFRWPAARWIGLGFFVFAFTLHTFSLMLRWYVSERWPNSNMFEAVTTAAWFGGCAAIMFEVFARRSAMRTLFALGSAVASMVALMCVHFFPLDLDAGIQNRMPVLHDVWLYIHTNVIIFSYCLIFMAAVSALLYLFVRITRSMSGGGHGDDYARVGGAAAFIDGAQGGGGSGAAAMRATSLAQVLDGTTMILIELSFVMLWAGLVMGAIWADHSWGRPWGWDPKEVFALNTFIVFAVLVHVRIKTRDKGLWTALIALVGAAVMLFNWIAINFIITGLHSYA